MMKPIHINLAPRSLKRSMLQTSSLTWLIGIVGLLLCGSALIKAQGLIHQYERTADTQRVQARQNEHAAQVKTKNTWSISEAQANVANSAIAQLNLPWRDLFEAIEKATPANVALISIEPDSTKLIARGVAETKNSLDMISYIERLKLQKIFVEAVLTKHEINDQDPNKPYRFQFEVQWTAERNGT